VWRGRQARSYECESLSQQHATSSAVRFVSSPRLPQALPPSTTSAKVVCQTRATVGCRVVIRVVIATCKICTDRGSLSPRPQLFLSWMPGTGWALGGWLDCGWVAQSVQRVFRTRAPPFAHALVRCCLVLLTFTIHGRYLPRVGVPGTRYNAKHQNFQR
jgi:hypothetical protein